jgi:hypothetical protein
MVFSSTVISKSGQLRFALLAALIPAASPPMTTNFITASCDWVNSNFRQFMGIYPKKSLISHSEKVLK